MTTVEQVMALAEEYARERYSDALRGFGMPSGENSKSALRAAVKSLAAAGAAPSHRALLRQYLKALEIAAAQIALLGGTPDPTDPYADQLQVGVQAAVDAAIAALREQLKD